MLNEQADRYDLPVGGPVINLPKRALALHDFLAANSKKLAMDDALMSAGNSRALEEYRQERAALARLERLQREGQLLPRDEARDALGRIAGTIRAAGDTLARQYGNDALEVLVEAIDDAQAEIDKYFGEANDSKRDTTPLPEDLGWFLELARPARVRTMWSCPRFVGNSQRVQNQRLMDASNSANCTGRILGRFIWSIPCCFVLYFDSRPGGRFGSFWSRLSVSQPVALLRDRDDLGVVQEAIKKRLGGWDRSATFTFPGTQLSGK